MSRVELEASQLREFGERGYLLVPGVVPSQVVEEARQAVGQLLIDRPPPVGHVGGHYLCGHNSSGNESRQTREVLYYRLRCRGHRARWRQCVTDALLEFDPVRAVLDRGPA